MTIEATQYLNQPMPDPIEDQHRWVVVGFWEVNPTLESSMLDNENVLTFLGPYCLYCDEDYPGDAVCSGPTEEE